MKLIVATIWPIRARFCGNAGSTSRFPSCAWVEHSLSVQAKVMPITARDRIEFGGAGINGCSGLPWPWRDKGVFVLTAVQGQGSNFKRHRSLGGERCQWLIKTSRGLLLRCLNRQGLLRKVHCAVVGAPGFCTGLGWVGRCQPSTVDNFSFFSF
jgi:hypothetical protein